MQIKTTATYLFTSIAMTKQIKARTTTKPNWEVRIAAEGAEEPELSNTVSRICNGTVTVEDS